MPSAAPSGDPKRPYFDSPVPPPAGRLSPPSEPPSAEASALAKRRRIDAALSAVLAVPLCVDDFAVATAFFAVVADFCAVLSPIAASLVITSDGFFGCLTTCFFGTAISFGPVVSGGAAFTFGAVRGTGAAVVSAGPAEAASGW